MREYQVGISLCQQKILFGKTCTYLPARPITYESLTIRMGHALQRHGQISSVPQSTEDRPLVVSSIPQVVSLFPTNVASLSALLSAFFLDDARVIDTRRDLTAGSQRAPRCLRTVTFPESHTPLHTSQRCENPRTAPRPTQAAHLSTPIEG